MHHAYVRCQARIRRPPQMRARGRDPTSMPAYTPRLAHSVDSWLRRLGGCPQPVGAIRKCGSNWRTLGSPDACSRLGRRTGAAAAVSRGETAARRDQRKPYLGVQGQRRVSAESARGRSGGTRFPSCANPVWDASLGHQRAQSTSVHVPAAIPGAPTRQPRWGGIPVEESSHLVNYPTDQGSSKSQVRTSIEVSTSNFRLP